VNALPCREERDADDGAQLLQTLGAEPIDELYR